MRGHRTDHHTNGDEHTAGAGAPGKRARTANLAVQRKAPAGGAEAAPAETAAPVPAADPFWFADAGVAGATAPLPHADAIQASFGHHDVGAIRAQVGGAAADASRALGAAAYATGDRVGFAGEPDLHTAAHEAAHVVQQRAGVHLKGGLDEAGDPYEQHADRVADLVVQGRSAEAALDARPASGGAAGAVVQRRMVFRDGTDYLNTRGAGRDIDAPGYRATIEEAHDMDKQIEVIATKPRRGTALYAPHSPDLEGEINIAPLAPKEIESKTSEYNNRLIEMSHETRHGIDDLTRLVKFRGTSSSAKDNTIRTEWRAFATQSAVAAQLHQRGQPFGDRYLTDIAAYASKEAFMSPTSSMVKTTASYLRLYELTDEYSEAQALRFMEAHQDWVEDAVALFHSLFPAELDEAIVEDLRPSGAEPTSWKSTLVVGGVIVGGVVLAALARYFKLFG